MKTLVEDYDLVVVGADTPDVRLHLQRAPRSEYSYVYRQRR